MKTRSWQDWVMLALGAWLCVAPFWMPGYASAVSTAAWNSYVLGVVVVLFAIVALASTRRWPEWIEVALAVWLVASPFIMLFYAAESGAAWNTIIVGVLVGANAIYVLAQHPTRLRMT